MVDVFLFGAVALLILGIVGSVVPLVPGVLLSLIAIYAYWWHTGFADPGIGFVIAATLVGGAALVADYFAGAISAKVGGASIWTGLLAAVVGLVLFFVLGPLGVVLGIGITVFVAEFYQHGDVEQGIRASAYSMVGALASTVVQFLITLSLLVGFLLAVLL